MERFEAVLALLRLLENLLLIFGSPLVALDRRILYGLIRAHKVFCEVIQCSLLAIGLILNSSDLCVTGAISCI